MAILHSTAAILFLSALASHQNDAGAGGLASAFTSPKIHQRSLYTHRSKYTANIILGVSSSSSTDATKAATETTTKKVDFNPSLNPTDIDSSNTPPSLHTILTTLSELKSGSDLRGRFVPHNSSGGTIANIAHLVKTIKEESGAIALTPFAAHCYGVAFAHWLIEKNEVDNDNENTPPQAGRPGKKNGHGLTICIGRDPRLHGERLADAFARGAESVDGGTGPVRVVYTGLATTPSMYEFVRAGKCDAAVMVSASHLPEEMNGLKFFSRNGGLTKKNIDELVTFAQGEARHWYDTGILPPSSGNAGVLCSELVDYMPYYQQTLKNALMREIGTTSSKPLSGINIIVNPGNGAGCFFDDLLRELGANVAGSMHLTPDGTFPISFGVPNPEKQEMVDETMRACEANNADIGVMFDTDADRAGFVLPRIVKEDGQKSNYEPLNKNRLIALLSVVFGTSSPGCTIVTDSTTSEGLNAFLEEKLGLRHYRFLRGYANVIGKAQELTNSGEANAEVAIETSGHCAMKENGYIDDGTYTAVKIIGLLARTVASGQGSLLDLISDLEELQYEEEFRFKATDGLLDTTTTIFNKLSKSLQEKCNSMDEWTLDGDNLEGVRVRLSSGGFLMIRQSLHDPVISFQVESISQEVAAEKVMAPMRDLVSSLDSLDYSSLGK